MLLRLLAGAGLFAFGYYLGKQVGMTEPLREELARAREKDTQRQASEIYDEDRR